MSPGKGIEWVDVLRIDMTHHGFIIVNATTILGSGVRYGYLEQQKT